jgi:hypothetical protein
VTFSRYDRYLAIFRGVGGQTKYTRNPEKRWTSVRKVRLEHSNGRTAPQGMIDIRGVMFCERWFGSATSSDGCFTKRLIIGEEKLTVEEVPVLHIVKMINEIEKNPLRRL